MPKTTRADATSTNTLPSQIRTTNQRQTRSQTRLSNSLQSPGLGTTKLAKSHQGAEPPTRQAQISSKGTANHGLKEMDTNHRAQRERANPQNDSTQGECSQAICVGHRGTLDSVSSSLSILFVPFFTSFCSFLTSPN